MAQRELDPRLKALFDAKKKVYSISKLNTIDQCEYQAYLSYVKHAKQSSSCYSILGTRIHDCLEAIINGEMDDYPEAAFYNVGTLDDVIAKAKAIEEGNA